MNKINLNKLYDYVKKYCKVYDSTHGYTDIWKYHIEIVVNNALILAEKYGADKEIVEIASLLHDIANLIDIKNNNEQHHIIGAEMAEALLTKCNYPKEKIEIVAKCILHHRGSVNMPKQSMEEICVADADAISHFHSFIELIYWRARLGETFEQACTFVKDKLTRSYNKMSEPSRKYYKTLYNTTISILNIAK